VGRSKNICALANATKLTAVLAILSGAILNEPEMFFQNQVSQEGDLLFAFFGLGLRDGDRDFAGEGDLERDFLGDFDLDLDLDFLAGERDLSRSFPLSFLSLSLPLSLPFLGEGDFDSFRDLDDFFFGDLECLEDLFGDLDLDFDLDLDLFDFLEDLDREVDLDLDLLLFLLSGQSRAQ